MPERKPYQIILIEHLFYPFLGFIFLGLALGYGPKMAAVQTDLSAENISEIAAAMSATIFALVALFALPFSCHRMWKSAGFHLTSFWKILCRTYAAVLAIASLLYGFLMSIALPGLYILAWHI